MTARLGDSFYFAKCEIVESLLRRGARGFLYRQSLVVFRSPAGISLDCALAQRAKSLFRRAGDLLQRARNWRELRSRAGPRARGEPAILRIAWAIRARKIISDHAGRLPRRKTHLLDKNPRTPPRPPLQFPGRKIFSTPKKPKTIQRSKFLTNFVAVISEKPETEDYNREQLRTLFATTTIVPLHGLRPGSFPTGGDDMTEEHPLAVFCSPGLTRLLRPLPTTTDTHSFLDRTNNRNHTLSYYKSCTQDDDRRF